MCFAPQRRALFRHLNFQKWSERGVFFNILTSKCASRHNGVHFFDISTSKSGLTMVCFVHFDLEMCFAPQRRALFRHLNFQKWSGAAVFCAFWLPNVLRATTACKFSSLIWPDGSAPAALASLLFDPPEPQIIGKAQWIATFLPFRASASSFFWLFPCSDLLSSVTLPISTFHLPILSEVWLPNFLRFWWYDPIWYVDLAWFTNHGQGSSHAPIETVHHFAVWGGLTCLTHRLWEDHNAISAIRAPGSRVILKSESQRGQEGRNR